MDAKESLQFQAVKKIHPKTRASLLSNLFFCWALPFFVKGYRKDLNEDDLYGPLKDHESRILGDRLEAAWLAEQKSHKNPSLWRAIIKVFGKEFVICGIPFVIQELVLKNIQPLSIGQLMVYYSPNQTSVTTEEAYIYAGAVVLSTFFIVLIVHGYVFALAHLGMKIRIACCSVIYRKALRLSKSALVETTVGQMVNIVSNDVSRFDMACIHLHNMWLSPIETLLVMYFLYVNVGPTSLVGVGILVAFIPLQLYIGKMASVYRMRTALKTDQRVRLMNEIISGIQVIKMYTWEKPFAKLVEKARKLEIHQVKSATYLRAINVSFMMFMHRASTFLCILTYVLTGNPLQAQYVYLIIAFYENLRGALTIFLPHGMMFLGETIVSVRRIKQLLLLNELEHIESIDDSIKSTESNGISSNGVATARAGHNVTKDVGIFMQDVSTKWVKSSEDHTLSGITVEVNPKQIVAIVGTVGSGKSTLLHVIINELSPISGTLEISGSISYASQEPWLFAGSIKQNILFGQEMNDRRYKEVVRVCALERDLSLFPYGDRTIVGERGVMLSGGQKARINLARAVYKNADIYLLDDPLSAVDTHVGKQLFNDCIQGYLRDKCVVLVTHQLQYLRNVDKIYLLENGKIEASGTYSELQDAKISYLKLLQEKAVEQENEETLKDIATKSAESSDNLRLPEEVKEQQSVGNISRRVYKSYLKAGGGWGMGILLAILFLVSQIVASGSDLFLSFWVNLEQRRQTDMGLNRTIELRNNLTDDTTNSTETEDAIPVGESFLEMFLTTNNCLYIYTALILLVIINTFNRSLTFFMFCMRASRKLHNTMFSQIVRATMWFFNTNPSGRILNRFSKDIGSIDEVLPTTIIDTIQVGLTSFSITIVISTVNPWILIPTVVLFGLFYYYRVVFLATSRDLKRIEGITRSPVFSHLSASLQGLTTIRAFGAQNILMKEFDNYQDRHSSAFYYFLACSRTFGFWLDMNCTVYIALVTMSFFFLTSEIFGGNVGLAITQSLALTGMLQWGMRQWSELENQMTSVERVVEYTELPSEIDDETKLPPKSWPEQGEVEFRQVSMRYSANEPYVLKNLQFKIQPGEKVGIVGRTGAGKSSLITAIFRLVEIDGQILIDGLDTKTISLNSLRSKIAIIPQEPVLFSGTLRKNLDPFDEYSDSELWSALEEVELKTVVTDLPSGLLSAVAETGSNFSMGQRQLLCLARAVIRKNKILVLDEATANVDPQTDELIQTTIRRKFIECTVLTIAHRLHTVMDSDKILVMDAGRAVEYDHPHILLQNVEGMLHKLVQQTGKDMAESLTEIARQTYHQQVFFKL